MTSTYLYDIQTRGNRPIYEFLYEQIRNDILKGKIKTGERLPSKRALAQQLNISVATIEKTYHELSLVLLQDNGVVSLSNHSLKQRLFMPIQAKSTGLILTIWKKTSRRLIFRHPVCF